MFWSVYLPNSQKDPVYSYSVAAKSEAGYLGLVNQAMTCYLNSLLQTLYMTPEFRNALYRQVRRAIETTDLTRSFGWDSSEVWQQHDVQELCRVMFDALEQKWKNTCGYESARVDAYLDIPLVIRPFGSSESYGSVIEAMNAFVQPEILDGTNQYFCEKCNKKCNAHKGLKFVSFPYLLTLQLKKFDFDYATMHRIKLNDKMTFPEILDLNQFITSTVLSNKESEGEEAEEDKTVMSNGQVDSSDEGIDEGIEIENGCSAASSGSDSSSISGDATANNTRNSYYSGGKGPHVYELFSIMIHSGSAAGGHYYAYVKSFKDGQWYSFNDQQVTKITYDDIRKTYGGSSMTRGFYSSAYTSSTSAYMLMYRQIDKTQNADFMQPEEFPEFLKAELRFMKEKEEAERRQREIDKSTCKIKVYCFHPEDQHKTEAKLEIHKDKTLLEATEIARELFNLETVVPLDCCRLVKYDEYQDSLEKSFEGEESSLISNVLGGVKSNYTFDLLLETKRPGQSFIEYKPGGVTVKVFLVDIFSSIIHPPISVRAYHVQTVAEFKLLLQQMLGYPAATMRCVLERFHNDLRPLVEPSKTLKAEGFYKSNKVFIECSGDLTDNSIPYNQSRLCHLLDQYQNTIRITCCLPSRNSVQEYLSAFKEFIKSPYRGANNMLSHTSKQQTPHAQTDGDEGISEHDSAFYSGATNSKHSLSGVDPGSNFSISSSATTDTRYVSGTLTNLSQGDDVVAAADNEDAEVGVDKNETPRLNSDCESSSGIGEDSNKVRDSASASSRLHSSSHEQLTVDMANVCSKLSSACLTSSRSDPSIYHTCADHSDDSLQCLGSGPSTGSQEDTSTSAEFNFSCTGPDPEPILSSPEDGFGFEEDNDEEKETDLLDLVSPRVCGSGRRSGIVIHELDLGSISHFPTNFAQFPNGHLDPEEDWDRDTSVLPQQESIKPKYSFPSSSFHAEAPWGFPSAELDNLQTGASGDSSHPLEEGEKDIDLRVRGHPPPPPPPLPPPPPHLFTERHSSKSTSLHSNKVTKAEDEEEEVKRYFCAVMSEGSDSEERILNVSVDKRITLGSFKQYLQPYVGVAANFFKVYRVYSNNQEFESVRLSDTLSFFEDGKFNIKLGRALQSGEHRVKVYQLCVNDPE
ncbi:Ubiquitin carboxyl-terminal hydrolase 47, partial [Bulinus truncatus]